MTDSDSEQPVEDEHTLFIVEADDLDESNPYQVTMLEHPPDSAQATAVEEAMRQLVETAEEETGERHRLVTEVDTPAVTEANYEMHTELLESEELATDGGVDQSEAATEQFIFNASTDTVHRGTREEGPECGTHIPSEVGSVDASDAEEAVMKYNLVPCSKCIDRNLRLNRWRVDVHGSTVIYNADTPERWRNAF